MDLVLCMLTYLRKQVKYARSSPDQETLIIGEIQMGMMATTLGSEVRCGLAGLQARKTPLSAV